MPCDYRIFASNHLIVKKFCGCVTYRCVLDLFDRIEADPCYDDGMAEFDDLRNIIELRITAREIEKFADLIRGIKTRKRGIKKKAILASSGTGRIAAEAFCEEVQDVPGLEVRVFATPEAAFDFLGMSPLRQRHILEWGGLTLH